MSSTLLHTWLVWCRGRRYSYTTRNCGAVTVMLGSHRVRFSCGGATKTAAEVRGGERGGGSRRRTKQAIHPLCFVLSWPQPPPPPLAPLGPVLYLGTPYALVKPAQCELTTESMLLPTQECTTPNCKQQQQPTHQVDVEHTLGGALDLALGLVGDGAGGVASAGHLNLGKRLGVVQGTTRRGKGDNQQQRTTP